MAAENVGAAGATQHVDMPGLNVRTAWREARDVEDLLDHPSRDRSIAKVTARDPAGHDLVDRALRSAALLARSDHGFFRFAHPGSDDAHLDSLRSSDESPFGQSAPRLIAQKVWRT